ncbi:MULTISPECIES: DUF2271 domain-containing protein [unclassified Lentimicrobium]|uniref:DUF2271 domain-containing protein n=1 Tax=unclassified Lentimicrobium TaxID=2677434 RepID=UPI001556BAF1|nr:MULTISPECIES: DUF2271 domain-containing protein [unclassified Lentimicrobium]NPD46054.1 DUF2271 domain-containing protein [Lentimicrobium sp. S6]NPD84958.1 DUF2271 domain-containing protein [Lentimicrobium sp. L6]
MKKTATLLLLSLFASIGLFAQTYGELTVTATTSNAGGNYNPRNVVAIWVENDNGEFVKTLMAYAQNRKTHLNTWQASTGAAGSEYNTTDAITGATRNSHATRSCTWNGLDFNGDLMPDGTYHVWMELTDKNNTGNYSSFTFTKGIDPDTQTPADVPSFAGISIHWQPSGTGIAVTDKENLYSITNNPGNGIYTIKGAQFDEILITTMAGKLVYQGQNANIDLSKENKGMYLLTIKNDRQKTVKKLIKN